MWPLWRAGENTGDLGGVLSKLADALEARQALQQKVSAAFIYPAIVTIVALMVVVGLLTYVVPQVVSVFESSNQELPTITVVMIALSDLLREWGWLMAIVIALAIYLFRNALKNKAFKLKYDEAVLTIPVVGPFVRAVNTARLASTLSILVGSGVPILKALAAANRTLGNSALQLAMVDVQERVKEGSGLSKGPWVKVACFRPCLRTWWPVERQPANWRRCLNAPRTASVPKWNARPCG
jgi:general secretion pathway protein F